MHNVIMLNLSLISDQDSNVDLKDSHPEIALHAYRRLLFFIPHTLLLYLSINLAEQDRMLVP